MTNGIRPMKWMIVGCLALILAVISGVGVANSQPTGMCVPAPERVTGLAWDGQHVWLSTNPFGGTSMIHQMDPATGQLLASFPAPSDDPAGLTFDGQNLWMVDPFEIKLYQINRTTQSVVRQIDAPDPFLEGLTWDGRALWSLAPSETLVQINPVDGAVMKRLPAPADAQRLAWDGLHLWVAEFVQAFKIDPVDGDVFESVSGGTISGLTFDGTNLLSAESFPDEICSVAIDTSPGVSATIIPPSTTLLQSQGFDDALLVKTPDVTVTRAVIALDGQAVISFPPDPMSPLPPPFANCLISGMLSSPQAQTFRCPGLTGAALGAGSHTVEATVELSDGRMLTDTALWIVLENTES